MICIITKYWFTLQENVVLLLNSNKIVGAQGITKPQGDGKIHIKPLGDNYRVVITIAYDKQCLFIVLTDEYNIVGESLLGVIACLAICLRTLMVRYSEIFYSNYQWNVPIE